MTNKNHNPFRGLVNRLSYFLKHNNVTAAELIRRLRSSETAVGVSVLEFANFMKQKVDKKRDESELLTYTTRIDVDKDGFVSETDIITCIKNLSNTAFWRNNGAALAKSTFNTQIKHFPQSSTLTKDKALEVIKQINEGLGKKKITYRDCFDLFDTDKDNMVSYAEFSRGLNSVVILSGPVMEQLYSLMDKFGVGLITY